MKQVASHLDLDNPRNISVLVDAGHHFSTAETLCGVADQFHAAV